MVRTTQTRKPSAACRFTVLKQSGKPLLVVQLYQDIKPLRGVSLGFNLHENTSVDEGEKLAQMLNERVLDLFVVTKKAVPGA